MAEPKQLKRVICDIPISLLPDEEKLRRKRDFTTAAGKPKKPKYPLTQSFSRIKQIELYNGKHSCDICESAEKSPLVALVCDETDGTCIHAAGDCLKIHYGEDLSKLAGDSASTRDHLEDIAAAIGSQGSDTAELIRDIRNSFEASISFDCSAVDEARRVLAHFTRHPELLADRSSSGELKQVRALILLQKEHATAKEHFEARWRALRHHPNLTGRPREWRTLGGRFLDGARPNLILRNFGDAVDIFSELRNEPVKLKHKDVDPANFTSRDAYEKALRKHFVEKVDTLPVPQPKQLRLVTRDDVSLEGLLEGMNAGLLLVAFSNYRGVRTPIDRALENLEQEMAHRKAQGRNLEMCFSNGPRFNDSLKHQDKYHLGSEKRPGYWSYKSIEAVYYWIAIWEPDRWTPAYLEWKRFSRESLEEL
jgi:hypothetical protein